MKTAERRRIDTFELWCRRKLLRAPWTARRSNQSILKELVLGVHWKDWCWSWNANTLATSCEELTHWKRPWCWEGLGAGGDGDDREWDGWMASPTRWTWVWVNSGSWWWTGRPGVLQFMGLQRVGHDEATELNWTEPFLKRKKLRLGKLLKGTNWVDSEDEIQPDFFSVSAVWELTEAAKSPTFLSKSPNYCHSTQGSGCPLCASSFPFLSPILDDWYHFWVPDAYCAFGLEYIRGFIHAYFMIRFILPVHCALCPSFLMPQATPFCFTNSSSLYIVSSFWFVPNSNRVDLLSICTIHLPLRSSSIELFMSISSHLTAIYLSTWIVSFSCTYSQYQAQCLD